LPRPFMQLVIEMKTRKQYKVNSRKKSTRKAEQ